MRRAFKPSERFALYLAADGKCQNCGKPVQPNFHADHIHPYSKGGATDVINGQVLCAECNLKKGAKVLNKVTEWTKPLRDWQARARRQYAIDRKQNFLVVATPGAGKTTFALRIAHDMLEANTIQRVLIVVPSENLKTQWAKAAHQVHIELDPQWRNTFTSLADDFIGAVVTYQQITAGIGVDKVRMLTYEVPTLAILDEIHHAGDNKSWGDSLRAALDHDKSFRLALSGTPFRQDNNQIPFVEYDGNKSRADFPYTYADALRDSVCRPIFFPTFDGELEWFSRSGEIMTATFDTELSEPARRERLNTAISATGEWLSFEFQKAHDKLIEVRRISQPTAKGLVICKDQYHAKQVAELVERISGKSPAIAISDDPDASKTIDGFGKSDDLWLVSVKMVSEGVDIPNLRVGVFATNVLSELFFRQFVGRFVRMQPDIEDQSSYIYIPRDPDLLQYATAIKEERDHYLEEKIVIDLPPKEVDPKPRQESMYFPVSSNGIQHNTIDVDGRQYTPGRIEEARLIGLKLGQPISPETIAQIIELVRPSIPVVNMATPKEELPAYDARKRLKDRVAGLARKYCQITGAEYWWPHSEWQKHGGSKHDDAPIEELQRKQDWLIQLIKETRNVQ